MQISTALALLLLVPTFSGNNIRGIWRGTGIDERYTLIFSGDVLIVKIGNHPLAGTRESGFRVHNGEIDIERTDGTQLGRYSIDNDTLTLTLANVNEPRPLSVAEKPRWKYRTYVFERQD